MNEIVPVVSVACITYNQENYIRQCLDGFVIQETNFPLEIVIHDDASTDGTANIIREYVEKYPNIIWVPVFQKENKYKEGKGILAPYVYPKCKGKYIALCEGDDYWTDPYKLQKQVDFLESHQDYSMCFHTAIEHWEDNRETDKPFCLIENRDYTGEEIFKQWTVATASVLYRREIIESDLYKKVCLDKKFIYGDIILFLTCANFGKVRGLSDEMSVYRRQQGGAVYNYNVERQKRQAYHELEMYKVFGKKYKEISIQRFAKNAIEVFWNEKSQGCLDLKLLFDIFKYSPVSIYKEFKSRI